MKATTCSPKLCQGSGTEISVPAESLQAWIASWRWQRLFRCSSSAAEGQEHRRNAGMALLLSVPRVWAFSSPAASQPLLSWKQLPASWFLWIVSWFPLLALPSLHYSSQWTHIFAPLSLNPLSCMKVFFFVFFCSQDTRKISHVPLYLSLVFWINNRTLIPLSKIGMKPEVSCNAPGGRLCLTHLWPVSVSLQ